MQQNDYMSRKQKEGFKKNGQLTKSALARLSKELQEKINSLKNFWYTSPKGYGQALANSPRHAHANGRRVLHTNNF